MKYESYKKFFSGGFFPVDSLHKLVNLEDTGKFTVKATLDSGQENIYQYAQTKADKFSSIY